MGTFYDVRIVAAFEPGGAAAWLDAVVAPVPPWTQAAGPTRRLLDALAAGGAVSNGHRIGALVVAIDGDTVRAAWDAIPSEIGVEVRGLAERLWASVRAAPRPAVGGVLAIRDACGPPADGWDRACVLDRGQVVDVARWLPELRAGGARPEVACVDDELADLPF